jgi:precorrin-6B methylase 1
MTAEHLLIFPDRETAEDVADDLEARGYREVRVVREALAGEDDSEDHEWAVHVRTPAEESYAAQLQVLAADQGGWYDAEV